MLHGVYIDLQEEKVLELDSNIETILTKANSSEFSARWTKNQKVAALIKLTSTSTKIITAPTTSTSTINKTGRKFQNIENPYMYCLFT